MTTIVSFVSWLLSIAAALWTLAVVPQNRADVMRRTLQWSAGGAHTLEISNIRGSIHVTGTDGAVVELVARRADAAASRMAVQEDGGLIRVCADAGRCGCRADDQRQPRSWRREPQGAAVDFELRVPRGTRLSACTVADGNVVVEGMADVFDVRNVNGGVALSNMRGSGSARTVNGSVHVAFAAAPTADCSFSTVNGEIEAQFPDGLAADLRLKTLNGGLYTDFDASSEPEPAAAPERRNGRYIYRGQEFAHVRVGGGGPQLTFQGLNGDIRVLRAR
jgi:hypothetical protein